MSRRASRCPALRTCLRGLQGSRRAFDLTGASRCRGALCSWRRAEVSLGRGRLLLSRRRVSAHGDDEPVAGSAVELGRQQREEDREGLSVEAEPVAAVGFARNEWRTR